MEYRPRRSPIATIFMASCAIALIVGIVLLEREHTRAQTMQLCAEQQWDSYLPFQLYMNEHDGDFPPVEISRGGADLAPVESNDDQPFRENYVTGYATLVSPTHPRYQQLVAHTNTVSLSNSYWYLGHRIYSEEEGLVYAKCIVRPRFETVKVLLSPPAESVYRDVTVIISGKYLFVPHRVGFSNRRWRAGSEELWHLVVDKMNAADPDNRDIVNTPGEKAPILIERPQIHGDGGHVLWSDGTVEFIPYPGEFPMTEQFIAALEELDPAEPPLD